MIVIPDVHGRSFWRSAVQGREDEEIIFLGDYLDPYDYEKEWDINEEWHNLEAIVEFKKAHPKNVTLLIGNHDWHYMGGARGSRWDWQHHIRNASFFERNKNLFQLAYEKKINGKRFIFSHAGIQKEWLKSHKMIIKGWTDENIVDFVNNAFEVEEPHFLAILDDISFNRGGDRDEGSMVWADMFEFLKKNLDKFDNTYMVFGHTQMEKYPFISDYFANLDIRRAFEIKDDGEIYELSGEKAIKEDELKKMFDK